MRCYWPEIHTYCGCCSLNTGIFIRSTLGAVINISGVIGNCGLLVYLFSIGDYIEFIEFNDIENILDDNITEIEKETVSLLYKILIGYLISWVILKGVYMVSVIFAFYAILKKKPKILKLYMYINVPNWIFDLVVTAIGAVLSVLWMKMVLVICILSEGYNLLAINSAYKQMTGKSRLVSDDEVGSIVFESNIYPNDYCSPPPYGLIHFLNNNQKHCITCTCNLSPVSNTGTITGEPQSPVSPTETSLYTPPRQTGDMSTQTKALNFKEESVIYDQNQLVERESYVIDNNTAPYDNNRPGHSRDTLDIVRGVRPNILSLSNLNEYYKDMSEDIAVIYDQDQLNVGTSPIIEDRIRCSMQSDK